MPVSDPQLPSTVSSEVSDFSDPDRAASPEGLVAYLDATSAVLSDVKARLDDLVGLDGCRRWLDLGCGVGQDLLRGRGAVGVDRSRELLVEGRRRWPAQRVSVADGHTLPFGADVFDGCRVDRVLQHVDDPAGVLAEVHRVLAPGARVGIFEPDWAATTFDAADGTVSAAVVAGIERRARHGRVGRTLGRLLVEQGFTDVEQVPDAVSVTSLEAMTRIVRFGAIVDDVRAEMGGRRVDAWMSELRGREADGALWIGITRAFAVGSRPRKSR